MAADRVEVTLGHNTWKFTFRESSTDPFDPPKIVNPSTNWHYLQGSVQQKLRYRAHQAILRELDRLGRLSRIERRRLYRC